MLSPGTVSVRHIALVALAVLVSGLGIFLFFEVRASPAAPQVDAPAPRAAVDRSEGSDSTPVRTVAAAERTRSYSSGLRNSARQATGDDTSSTGGTSATPSVPVAEDGAAEGKLEGPKLDAVMAEANRAYDKMEFDEARSIAQKVLAHHPTNSRMLRIMTSSHCIESDQAEAQKYYNLLPVADREQMKTRCARYGVTFLEPPAK